MTLTEQHQTATAGTEDITDNGIDTSPTYAYSHTGEGTPALYNPDMDEVHVLDGLTW
jgi:hypothetical protein